jgi:sporulation integral membrane protein YlbJ
MIKAQFLHQPSSIIKSRLLKINLLLFLALILLFPSLAFAGAKNGLLLWWDTLLPTLLPFMIISGLIIRLRITRALSYLFYPVFKHLLPISREGCYPVFIGFLAGYPVGAKTTADLTLQSSLSTKEAQLLCAFTNNASPMFVLGFIAGAKLLSPQIGLWLLLILNVASYLSALAWFHLSCRVHKCSATWIKANEISYTEAMPRFQFNMLDDSILNAFEVVTKVGGYIVLFSVLASFIRSLPIGNATITACLTGILEITTGIQNISVLNLPLDIKIILITTITAFGGLSGFAQTKSVISQTMLSSTSYFLTKLLSALFALLLSILFVLIK